MRRLILGAALILLSHGCASPRQYELTGQVLSVNSEGQQVTIRHEDIRGFMPAMTMPFRVKERALLTQSVPGDLVRATLVVGSNEAYLTAIERIGHAPLPDGSAEANVRAVLEAGAPVPDVRIVDQHGVARQLSDWRGDVLAVTFIYTRCPFPNFCPVMDGNFAAAQREIQSNPQLRGRARLVSVSFDPQFDTPEILAAHARRAGADPAVWSFVTGDAAEIDAFAGRFGLSIIREDAKEIVHNLRTAVIDREGRVTAIFSGSEWPVASLLEAMRRAGA